MTKFDLEIKSEFPLFIRINVTLSHISKDMKQAEYAGFVFHNETNERMRSVITDSIGRSLYNVYCRMEVILEKIAMEIDNSIPDDENHDLKLLRQMSESTKNRPAVIDLTFDLQKFRSFRNRFGNPDGKSLKQDEIIEKLNVVKNSILPEFIQNLNDLRVFLETNTEVDQKDKNSKPIITRYRAILNEYADQQYKKLERAANDVRNASQKHGIAVKFFGSFANNRVDRESDLDVLLCSDTIPFDLKLELNRIAILHNIEMDVMKECNAPHPDVETIP